MHRRRGAPRSRTVARRRITQRELRVGRMIYPLVDVERPTTREECGLQRPCPWVGCRYHLYLDVGPTGAIKFNFPDLEPWQLRETCALDVAERGGITLNAVGEIINLTRERVRQIEATALDSFRRGHG